MNYTSLQEQQNGRRYTAQKEIYLGPTFKSQKRDITIDLLRGLAVALMIITHVIALLYDHKSQNPLIENIGLIGGTASFSAFLFISGISAYFSYLRFSEQQDIELKRKSAKLFGRSLKILLVYYVLSFASLFALTSVFSFPPSTSWIETISKTTFFLILPEFAEFLITLVFFAITLAPFRKIYKFLLSNAFLGIILAVAVYSVGGIIYRIDLSNDSANTIKALFVGHEGLHTFPILLYFPVYLFGLYFGQFLYNTTSRRKVFRVVLLWTVFFMSFTIQSFFASKYIDSSLFEISANEGGRFPPGLGFLSFSLSITFGGFLALLILRKAMPPFIKALFHFMGTNALDLFFFHTILLFAFRYLTTNEFAPLGKQYNGTLEIIIIYIILVVASIVLTNLKNNIKDWAMSEREDKDIVWWFFTEKAISTIIFVLIFSFFGANLYRTVFADSSQVDNTNVQFKKRLIREEEWPIWWDHTYSTYRQVFINNTSGRPIYKSNWVRIEFDHQTALGTGKSFRAGGEDIRIVFYDEKSAEFKEIPFLIENPNSTNTKIFFKIEEDINGFENNDKYFLYYGNERMFEYPKSQDAPGNEPLASNISLGTETRHSIDANINRKWYLKKKERAYQAASLIFTADLKNDAISDSSIVTYTISGTDKFGKMKLVGNKKYQAAVVVSDLEPGVYDLQAHITESTDSLKIYRSQKVPFYVTYPLYVSWTQDWEGWGVNDADLNDIASIANNYQAPITHFFNPRIYIDNQYTIQSINETDAGKITAWVKKRQQERFDEIGMHIHMWTDMVAAVGVPPKSSPVIIGTYGVDVATYNYSQAELEQVFKWGRQQFADNDLGAPISYRTGAWMSAPHVLKAAQNSGFLIDSSGRTGGPVNVSIPGSTPVPWNLPITTRPYLPSVNDINSWTGERLKIWEFPNNGADSYWFSKEELISRFDQNYPNKGSIMYTPQVVTYLSHPHWFTAQDTWKIRGLFNYTDQFLYRNDSGPVIYATLETIYSEWDRDKFINGN